MKKYHLIFLVSAFVLTVGVGTQNVIPFYLVYVPNTPAAPSSPVVPKVKPRAELFKYFTPQSQIVMVGDSITQGGIWAEFFPNYTVANRGVGGDTAEDLLNRMDPILSVEASVAFLMVGINDIYSGIEVEKIYQNYLEIVSILQENDVRVVIQSTFECSVSKCFDKNDEVIALNDLLAKYANESGILYLDLNEVLTDEGGLIAEVTYDGIHLNGEGYRRWVSVLEPVFEALILN